MEKSQGAFRVGIIGAGLISDLHITGLQRLANVAVVAIADSDLSRAQQKAQQYGIRSVFENHVEMLQAASLDAVHVLTPPSTHANLCVAALEAGAHVYVEKPMAASDADCERMIEAARKAGRELCAGHSLVYDPLLAQALDAIARGDVGEVVHASATYCFDPRRIPGYNSKAWYRRLAGGFVEDLATHPASVLLRVIGSPRTIRAAPGREGDDGSTIAAVLEGERGSGSLLVSLRARPEDVSLRVYGTRGTVHVNFSSMVVSIQRERKLPRKLQHGVRNFTLARDLVVQTATNTARFLAKRIDTTKGIHTLIAAFYRALAEQAPAPVPPQEGRDVVRLLRTLWPHAHADRPPRWVLSDSQPHAVNSAAGPVASGRMRQALVTGATGFIGRHLVARLVAGGVRVRAFARDAQRAQSLSGPGVEVVIGDLGDAAAIEGLAEGIDTIYHLGSVMVGNAEDFEQVDLAGGRRLIAEAKRAGVARFVFTSTMGAYALAELADGAVVTEEMVDEPERVGHYARAKLLIERMLRAEHDAGRLEAVVVRPGLVFGPGTSPYLEHLPHLGSFGGDRYLVFGDGEVPLQLTYVSNTVEALRLCGVVPEAAGQTFTIIDDELPTQKEFVAQLASLVGRPLRVRLIPRRGAYLIGLGVEALSAALRKRPATTRRLLVGKTVKLSFDTGRAKRVLGWQPEVAWQEGLRRAVEWSRSKPAAAASAHAEGDEQLSDRRTQAV